MTRPPVGVDPLKQRVHRIDILACSVAAGSELPLSTLPRPPPHPPPPPPPPRSDGMALIHHLEKLTETNFAASVDPTGNDKEGHFDYELESDEV